MKPTLEERQSLWRYLYARTSLIDALDWITLLESSGERSAVADALFTAAIVSYARPFKSSQFPGKKSSKALDEVPPQHLLETHNVLLLLRDKVMGHKDATVPQFHSAPPNMILLKRDPEGYAFSTLVFTVPKPELRAQMQELCNLFITRCVSAIDSFRRKYGDTLAGLSIGTYRIRHEDDDPNWIERIND